MSEDEVRAIIEANNRLTTELAEKNSEIENLKSVAHPRVLGMTDRMWERIAWLIVFILMLVVLSNPDEIVELLQHAINAIP